jgi:twitching motility protein PilJ
MALRLAKIFPDRQAAADTDLGIPTTQIRMSPSATATYDPLATASIMDQLRNGGTASAPVRKLPLVGRLPVVKQYQMLGVLLLTFAALAAFIYVLDGRTAAQRTASAAMATGMQMLSQRLARASAQAADGQPGALAVVRDSRDRFRTALDTFQNGGNAPRQ